MPLLRASLAKVSRTVLFHPCSTLFYCVHPWLKSPASPEINFTFIMFSKQSSQQLDVFNSSGGTAKAFAIPIAFAFSMGPVTTTPFFSLFATLDLSLLLELASKLFKVTSFIFQNNILNLGFPALKRFSEFSCVLLQMTEAQVKQRP